MTTSPDLRPACRLQRLRTDDLAAAAAQCPQLFPEAAWPVAAVRQLLETPGCFALLAATSKGAAGLVLARTAADECEILWIVVASACRRRGIGRDLLQAALWQAAGLGARAAFLEVADANHAALCLYAREGFRPCGRRESYYGNPTGGAEGDALILRKSLYQGRPTADYR